MAKKHEEPMLSALLKYTTYFIYAIYIGIAFGFNKHAETYLILLSNFVKIYISCFLIYKFNPLSKAPFTEFDREAAYKAGVLLFFNTIIAETLIAFMRRFKTIDAVFERLGVGGRNNVAPSEPATRVEGGAPNPESKSV
jgi:hypothetical protein